jgi:hypothetical protein
MHRTCILVVLLSSLAFAQNPPAPRASAKDYQASKVESQYSIGAKLLSKTQIQNSFATALAGRYVVIEVGFYPADRKTIDLERSNFTLVTPDGKSSVTPATPEEIASILQRRPASSRDVTLYPTANVGYESYPVYNGAGGVGRASGPVYGAGMGVGVGKTTSPATTDSDRKTMETELSDKELKSGDVSSPVAGYLYFPVSGKEKSYQLEYRGTDTTTKLTMSEK